MPRLTRTNYNIWAKIMEAYLVSRGVWYLIDEKAEGENEENDAEAREKDNAVGMMILLGTVEGANLSYILFLKTLREQWTKLRRVNVLSGEARLADLIKQFFKYRPKANEGVDEIASNLSTIQVEIESIDKHERPTEKMKIMVLLEALTDDYKLTTEIIRKSKETDFEKIVLSLRETERQISRKNRFSTESALFTRKWITGQRSSSSSRLLFKGECYHCKKQGHRKTECRQRLATEEGKEYLEKKLSTI